MTEPNKDPTNPLTPLIEAGSALLRSKLEGPDLHPHVFDEVAIAAKAIHKACTALDPVLNLPKPSAGAGPLAPSTQTEGAGATALRELVGALQNLGAPKEPRVSRKDLMAAIVVAERAGLTEDAQKLRADLHGDDTEIEDDSLTPRSKVDRAHDLLEESAEKNARAKALLDSVKPNQIIDTEATEATDTSTSASAVG